MSNYSKVFLLEKSKTELLEIAMDNNVVGFHKLNKKELIQAILSKTNPSESSSENVINDPKPNMNKADGKISISMKELEDNLIQLSIADQV